LDPIVISDDYTSVSIATAGKHTADSSDDVSQVTVTTNQVQKEFRRSDRARRANVRITGREWA
jgi:hypothetical protein